MKDEIPNQKSPNITTDQIENKAHTKTAIYRLERSAILTIIGVIILFSSSILVTLIAPRYVDSSWTTPSSIYQIQMHDIVDPHLYIRNNVNDNELQYVVHLIDGLNLLSFEESTNLRLITAEPDLEKFITRLNDSPLKLTSRLLMLREPAKQTQAQIGQPYEQIPIEQLTANTTNQNMDNTHVRTLELYDPHKMEAFSWDDAGGILQEWVDKNFVILDDTIQHPYHQDSGVVYVKNPQEFRVNADGAYDSTGNVIKNITTLTTDSKMNFRSRQELIAYGEHLYAIEGCWYCHTDQTRTLIQDTVLNGSDAYPAPPSSANEYIYQKITFPGTRRIGPDISRVGVKRPSRHWHIAHFWSPTTASVGSIMPSFKHFFHDSNNQTPIPNEQFEAIYQYLMTKGTRITAPTQAWWLGQDPINTKKIIEGRKVSS